VVQGKNGGINIVRFEQIGAMLLNEFLKKHKKAKAQRASIDELGRPTAKGIEILIAQLEEQGL
jgi:hypothetical protein